MRAIDEMKAAVESMEATAMATTDEKAERKAVLYAERKALAEQAQAIDRRQHVIDAEIAELLGDTLGAEWHRLAAAGDPGEHMAWVRMIAAMCVSNGSGEPYSERPEWNAQIAAEVERLRAEASHAS